MAKGVRLDVMPVEEGVTINAEWDVLAAVITNLLQNAIRFTRPRTTISLQVGVSAERVLIQVQDECGGLPGGDTVEIFRPRQDSEFDPGVGLAFSRWGAEANGGRLDVH